MATQEGPQAHCRLLGIFQKIASISTAHPYCVFLALTFSQVSCATSPSTPSTLGSPDLQSSHSSATIFLNPTPYELHTQFLGKAPRRCLALSGGGIRSALFALGVIAALADDDELLKFDVISSVSGGGYASAWILNEMHRSLKLIDFTPKVPFTLSSVYTQDRLNELFNSIAREYIGFAHFRNTMDVIGGVGGLGSYNMWDGIPGESSATKIYRGRLERTFLGLGFFESFFKGSSKLTEYQQTIVQNGLPNFVFNATVQGMNATNGTLPDLIFEFTPFFYGSPHTGYKKGGSKFTIGEVIATSGAALDKPVSFLPAAWAREILGFTLGRAILPIRTNDKIFYYWLSDGGHIENLGVYSLLRRGCSTIFVADAEEDPSYGFDGYRNLKQLVKDHLQSEIHMPFIDAFLQLSEKQRSGVYPEPVSVGWIERHNDTLSALQPTSRIIYLKLAYNANWKMDKEDKTFIEKLAENDPQFPQYPTVNQYGISRDGLSGLMRLGIQAGKLALSNESNYERLRNERPKWLK